MHSAVRYKFHNPGFVKDLHLLIPTIQSIYMDLMDSCQDFGCYPMVAYDTVELIILTEESINIELRHKGNYLISFRLDYQEGVWSPRVTRGNTDTFKQELYITYGRAVKGRYPAPTGRMIQ